MRIWVDMDNAPHVPVLAPIIRELRGRGFEVEITARDYGHTLPLLALHGLTARAVGSHAGRSRLKKYLFTLVRSLQLLAFAIGRRFDAALCHGARGVYLPAWLLGIPLITMGDFENATMPRLYSRVPVLNLFADAVPREALLAKGIPAETIRHFPGLKEDLYVHDFQPDPSFLDHMGIDRTRIVALVRPPATMAHYAVPESDRLFRQMLAYLASREDVEIVLIPRTHAQEAELRNHVRRRGFSRVHFPDRVYDGPSLVWHSDVVIGGGGTMNREAAALGVPAISIYGGALGGVDRDLIRTGRLLHVRSMGELKALPLSKRPHREPVRRPEVSRRLRELITNHIIEAVRASHKETLYA